jgi:hypothetical protein
MGADEEEKWSSVGKIKSSRAQVCGKGMGLEPDSLGFDSDFGFASCCAL